MKIFTGIIILQVIVSILLLIKIKRSIIFRLIICLLLTISLQNTLIFKECIKNSELLTAYESILEKQADKVINEIYYATNKISSIIKSNFEDTNSKINALSPSGPVSRYSLVIPSNGPVSR